MSRFSARSGLAIRSWAGESTAVIFVPDTVSTHLVSEVAAALLEIAAVNPVTMEEVSVALLAPDETLNCSEEDVGGDLVLIDKIVVGLVAAGLLCHVE